MPKRVILVHGWDGTPQDGWFPWLRDRLQEKGFEVVMPQMPDAGAPRIDTWVPALAEAVGTPTKETYFVGHSMGCQAIARYLDKLPRGEEVGGVVYVAGFFRELTNLEGPAEEELWETWRRTPVNLARVAESAPKSVAIFSDNDKFVPLSNADDFRNELHSQIVMKSGLGHFTEEGGVRELPEALDAVLTLASD